MTAGLRPAVSVVIPTRDRADVLRHTLTALVRQDAVPGGYEVLVVDNGPSETTRELLREFDRAGGAQFRYASEARPGPAAARNTGVREAAGEIALFLGDDMEPASDSFVRGHADHHLSSPATASALLGRVIWHPELPRTPFMQWVEAAGPQFDFGSLGRGPVPIDRHFVTANVSVEKKLLERVGGFDERFPYAAVEDIELGVRLGQAGIALEYEPDLLVLHRHPTTLAESLARMMRVGESGRIYNELHPEHPLPRELPVRAGRRVLQR